MNANDFETYMVSMGYNVEVITGKDNQRYTVIKACTIPRGGLKGNVCDIAILRVETVPYVVPAAIHTHPALVRMEMVDPLKTQQSGIGSEWQYWSRRYDHVPAPKALWAHILTVLGDDRWQPV